MLSVDVFLSKGCDSLLMRLNDRDYICSSVMLLKLVLVIDLLGLNLCVVVPAK